MNLSVISKADEDAGAFLFTDSDSGVIFSVPAGWKQKEMFEEREFIDAKFVSTKEEGCVIIYGSTDFWAQMTPSEKAGYTRSDLTNSDFSKIDIAKVCDTTVDKISTITYNGDVQYFKAENNYTSDVYGTDITVKMTQLVYVDNGWIYMFCFGGTTTHKLYSDFVSLLKSVQYPTVSHLTDVDSTNDIALDDNITSEPKTTNSNYDESLNIIVVAVSLIIVAMIVVMAVVTFKKNITAIKSNNYALKHSPPSPKSPGNLKPNIMCKSCGQPLPLDSEFCHICGEKIKNEED